MNIHLTLTPTEARRLAVACQGLAAEPSPIRDAPDADRIMAVARNLGCLQIDPIRAVEHTQRLVLWSRLGDYEVAELDRLVYDDAHLFEGWAHCASIVLTEDYPIHATWMRHHASRSSESNAWIEANARLYRHILDRLSSDGPLAAKEFDALVDVPWRSNGWNNGRNVGMMLDFLWRRGELMVARRRGRTRLWHLADAVLPERTPRHALSEEETVRQAAQWALRALGVATPQQIKEHFTRKRYPNLVRSLALLEAEGRIVRVQIVDDGDDGSPWPGAWFVHVDRLPLLDEICNHGWTPRTTLLSPFDNLIADRARTERLFGFHYRMEIYTPKAKRRYGYYVLPILHGERLIGRINPTMDRKRNRLLVHNVYAEADAPDDPEVARAVMDAIEDLADFLGAEGVEMAGPDAHDVPDGWRAAL